MSPPSLARNSLAMLSNQGGRVLLQAAYFVALARLLSIESFGAFSAIVALVSFIAPLSSFGLVSLTVRAVAVNPACASVQFATATAVTAGSGLMTAVLVTAVAPVIAPTSIAPLSMLAIGVADLICYRVVEIAGAVWQAQDRMFRTALFPITMNLLRFAALLVLAGLGTVSLASWALAYCLSSVAATCCVVFYTIRSIGAAPPDFGAFWSEWRDGALFSVGLSAQTVYNDIDKAMLARLSTLEATGIYSAAYRIIDMSFVPMRALLSAAYSRFFREGHSGVRAALRVTRQITRPGVVYCVTVSVLLASGASLVPVVLGPEYRASVGAVRALSVLPLLKCFHYLSADTLTGASRQGLRTVMQIGVALLNIALNWLLIPRHGVAGAVITSLISDGILAVSLWCVVLMIQRSERQPVESRQLPGHRTWLVSTRR